MTPEAKTIRILAEKHSAHTHRPTPEEISRGSYYQYEPNYLNSLDALRGVIEKLTEKDRCKLNDLLMAEWFQIRARHLDVQQHPQFPFIWLLTLPASALAPLVAQAIEESK